MPAILELRNFILEKSLVQWSGDELDLGKLKHTVGVDYEVFTNRNDENLYKLQQRVSITPVKNGTGYTIEYVIAGIFTFPEGIEKEKQGPTLLFNGNSMLYGALRGQIAAATAMFIGGKYTLPSLNFVEIVKEIEKEKAKKKKMIARPTKSKKPHAKV